MKYVFRGENIEVTESIKEYIKDKLSRIEKYLLDNEQVEARILIKVRGIEQKVEVTIPTKSYTIRCEESHNDLYAAIDLVVDKIERQIRKYKTKLVDKRRQQIIDQSFDFLEEDTEEPVGKVIKRKRLTMKPMDEEEAIVQMELLGHSFFVFKDVESNKINVLYKRLDGNYGIIEAE